MSDQWKLSVKLEFVPVNPDTKEDCHTCRGRGVDFFGDGDCDECHGNGFRYTRNTTDPQPQVKEHFWQWMRDAYLEYKELYGEPK